MNIPGIIKESLLFNEKIVLPGFGALFIKRQKPEIKGKTIQPPKAELIFDKGITIDDEVLEGKIAELSGVSKNEAKQILLEYIDEIRFSLNKGEAYTIEGVCILDLNIDNEIYVKKSPDLDLSLEFFGLDSFELEPLEEETNTTGKDDQSNSPSSDEYHQQKKQEETLTNDLPRNQESTRQSSEDPVSTIIPDSELDQTEITDKNNRSIVWVISGAIVIILAAFILIPLQTDLLNSNLEIKNIFSTGDDEMFEVNDDFSDISEDDFNFDELVDEMEEDIDSATSMENVLTIEENEALPQQTEEPIAEYHIIAGSFSDYVNARELQESLSMRGYQGKIIDRNDGLFRVSVASFRNKEIALNELFNFRNQEGMESAWLMNLK